MGNEKPLKIDMSFNDFFKVVKKDADKRTADNKNKTDKTTVNRKKK